MFANAKLLALLTAMHQESMPVNSKSIELCINLHKEIPYLQVLFKSVSPEEQRTMMSCMLNARGNKAVFFKDLIVQIPRIELIQLLLQEEKSKEDVVAVLAIVDVMKQAKREQDHSLHSIVTSQDFPLLVINEAVTHKEREFSGINSKAQAEQFIEAGLLNYFFQVPNPPILPTRHAGLQMFVKSQVITADNVKSFLKAESFLAFAVAKVIDTSPVLSSAREYIEKSSDVLADEALLNKVIANSSAQTTSSILR